ncbi:MAG: 1-deoxy-D-xylulose-5-phosphate reductoisomerase [Candidatus Sumerlaeota bacterium]|nr:1-deoxy-D-xylulose-5-phosphate reductoisomerase [Candidatus Sumerlaeota bacterium]
MPRKRLILFGSTGSIGKRTLDVTRDFRDCFEIVALSAGRNAADLEAQIVEFHPRAACLAEEGLREEARRIEARTGVPVLCGRDGLTRLAAEFEADMAVVATVGFAGLAPSLAAIDAGMDLALANKEVLVAAGELVTRRAAERGVRILPIDSEHNAVFQCLGGQDLASVRRVILTASGGPFRRLSKDELARVTVEQALAHPTWNMGPKITIDSSTLMNKGFEVIEAHHLFGMPFERVEVVIHPESTIHSMVEYVDGSILAQMGRTDMYLPIQNALTYPNRRPNRFAPLDFAALGALTFEAPDLERFPALRLAYEAGRAGGTAPTVLNAANEVAVARFLRHEIRYVDIPALIAEALEAHENQPSPTLDALYAVDEWARGKARRYVGSA